MLSEAVGMIHAQVSSRNTGRRRGVSESPFASRLTTRDSRALAAALATCLVPSGRVALDVIRHINRAARLLTGTRWFRWIASGDGTKAEPSDGPAYRPAPGFSAYVASWGIRKSALADPCYNFMPWVAGTPTNLAHRGMPTASFTGQRERSPVHKHGNGSAGNFAPAVRKSPPRRMPGPVS
jgi:hypothetical protein